MAIDTLDYAQSKVSMVWQLYAQSDLQTQEVTEKVHLRDAVS